ncbi:hypothetical protein [Pantanalinema sp. GBBB05]|uniref:hypothetical protein n=1 Tax=Pantanalinema sp. GBBB05 TaxID=2604139 RepID=UPI001D8DA9A3|nr:PatU [Pantanalinema sp. GBBB05]
MNRDSEAFQRQLLKLVQDLISPLASADAEAHPPLGQEVSGQPTLDASQAVAPQDVNLPTSGQDRAAIHSRQGDSLLELGDIPTVQERFQALLKHRLQSEIQKNPPLFPWESEIHDYESSSPAWNPVGAGLTPEATAGSGAKIPTLIWLRQLEQLELPVKVPQSVLAQLLAQCQSVMRSSLREGAKLVRAVEDLFPGQADSLNYLAGLVMTSPARSGSTSPATSASANFPGSYETAVPAQQMVLSLLAAREILSTLTLTVSAAQPKVDRQWLTELGALSLQVEYETTSATPSVRIQSTLPGGGSLTLQGNEQQSIARRPNAGNLSVELFGLQPGQFYVLDVQLTELEQATLTFVIQAIAA